MGINAIDARIKQILRLSNGSKKIICKLMRSKKKNKLLSNIGNKILKKTIGEINSISNAI